MSNTIDIKKLTNQRSLRKLFRDEFTLEQIELFEQTVAAVKEELCEDKETEQRERLEKEQKIKEFRELMLADGINPDDVFGGKTTKPKTKAECTPRRAKYCFMDGGEEKTWTGQGRKPKPIQQALDAGQSLDKFLIQTS